MKWIDRCYNSLRASTVSCDVMTIDNGSTDGTVDYIRKHFPEVQVVETGSNLGFGRGNNIGLKQVLDKGYDYAYLLNQDAWVMPDTFEKLIAYSESHPEYGVLSPLQMKADMKNLEDDFQLQCLKYTSKEEHVKINNPEKFTPGDVYDVPFVMAAHWFITRRCIEQTGGFSPTFPHYGEDDNYLSRVSFWGMKTAIVTSARAVHDTVTFQNKSRLKHMRYFTLPLAKASNPLWKETILRYAVKDILHGLTHLDMQIIKYGIRLFSMHKSIEKNYKTSITETCAFLERQQ